MTLKSLIIAAALFLTAQAHAGFVEYDWKEAGDKKAFLHEETGLEWLDLTESQGSYNQTLARLGAGGDLEGWRVATYDEVYAMLTALAGSTISATTNYIGSTAAHIEAHLNYKNLFGSVISANGDEVIMRGFYMNASNALRYSQAMYTTINSVLYSGIRVEQSSGTTVNSNTLGHGTFLVSTGGLTLGETLSFEQGLPGEPAPADVSLPSLGFALVGLGLMGFTRRRQR